MPKVQQYQPFQTSVNAVRSPAQQRANINTEGAFGEGIAKGASNLAATVENIKDEDDKSVAKERLKMYREFSRNKLFSNEDSFYNLKGQNAYSSREQYGKELQEYQKELAKDLSPNQSRYFSTLSDQYVERDLTGIDRHSMSERKVWQNQQDEAQIIQSQEDMATYYHDNSMYVDQIKKQNAVLAKRNGWSPEVAEINLDKTLTAGHISAIENIAVKNPHAAEVYFQENKDEISSQMWDDIENKLKSQTTASDAQSLSDMAIALGSESAARAHIKDNTENNPEVRKAAFALVSNEFAARQREKNRMQLEVASELDLLVDSGMTTDAIKVLHADKWALLTPAQRKALDTAESGKIDTDPIKYWEVSGLIAQGKNQEAEKLMTQYIGVHLSNTDAKKLADRLVKPAKEYGNAATDLSVFNSTMETVIGKEPTKGENREAWNARYNILYGMYQDRLDEWREDNPNKKHIPHEERQKVLDEFKIEAIKEIPFWFDSKYNLENIPIEDLQGIQAGLIKQDLPVTPENIMKSWMSEQ